jgi:hypothetical protein
MKQPTITFDELLAEWVRASAGDDSSKTTAELCSIWKCGSEKARKLIRRGIAEGRILTTRKAVLGIHGVRTPAASYGIRRIVP